MSWSKLTHLQGRAVSLANIEKELISFWQDAAKDTTGEAVIRASTLNLIVWADSTNQFHRAEQVIPQILSHHPSRAILAFVNPDQKSDRVEAAISAYCQISGSDGKQLCCEQITLETGPAGEGNLPGAILPLLLPGLPVNLWWASQSTLRPEKSPGLYQAIDRVIVESAESVASLVSFGQWIDRIIRLSLDMNVSDLRWARLTTWRESLANFFDSSREEIWDRIDHLTLTHTGTHDPTSAWLLAGWLISRLGWKLEAKAQDAKENFTLINRQGAKVEMRFATKQSDEPAGLAEVEIAITSDRDIRFLAATRQEGAIETKIWRGGTLQHQDRLEPLPADDGWLLCHELDFQQSDVVYLEALQSIRRLLKNNPFQQAS